MKSSTRTFVFMLCFGVLMALGLPSPSAAQNEKVSTPQLAKTLVFIGDSLTEGYGVKKEESYPERVGALLSARGIPVRIINGGISGSVSAEADARVKWFLKAKPNLIVLALGANDGLKGTPVPVIEKNLERAILVAKTQKIPMVLVGMRMLTNLGPEYGRDFEALYARLAKKHALPFYPFLLEGVALNRELNQSDMKHPNAKGQELIAQKMADFLTKQLE